MRLRAISKFHWRGNREIGDLFDCPEEIVAKRLIAEGNAEALTDLPTAVVEPAAPEKSETVPEAAPAAEIAKSAPVTKKSVHKKTSKKKN